MDREARVALPGGRLERLPELLGGLYRPDHIEALGAEQIRHFWASFANLDLQSSTGPAKNWTSQELMVLTQTRRRCVAATAPFPLVLRLLEDNWLEAGREEEEALLSAASQALDERKGREEPRASGAELLRKARDAAAAAKASEQWNVLLAVQHLIGRPPNESAPAWQEMQQELHRRREKVMLQAKTFLLISSLLGESSRPKNQTPEQLQARCQAEARRLLAAQRLVPLEWRSVVNPTG